MSNMIANIIGLVALLLLWGMAGFYDAADEASLITSNERSSAAHAPSHPPASHQVAGQRRMVCVVEELRIPAFHTGSARSTPPLVGTHAGGAARGEPTDTEILHCAMVYD